MLGDRVYEIGLSVLGDRVYETGQKVCWGQGV